MALEKLKLPPIEDRLVKNFIRTFMLREIGCEVLPKDLTEPSTWTELTKRTIERYRLRNPDSKFDIESAIKEVHTDYQAQENIRVRKY